MRKINFKGIPTLCSGWNTRLNIHGLGNALTGFRVAVYVVPLLILILAIAVITNPWHSTRWGGDTGEELYHVDPIVPDNPDNETENPFLCCSSYIPVVGVVFAYGLQQIVVKKDE